MNETQSTGEGSCIESGTWITYDNKLLSLEELKVESPNLENPGVEKYTSNAPDIVGYLYPYQPVDLDASMERDTWMNQNKEVVGQLVATIDTDKEDVLEYQKQLILLKLNGVGTSTNAQNAQVE